MKELKFTQQFWIYLVIGVTAVFSLLALLLRPETAKEEPKQQVRLVETVPVAISTHRVIIMAYGIVQAHSDVLLRSEVSGRVVEQSVNLDVGGIVKKDEVLLRLDPADYLITVEQEKAALERARFELKVEEGRNLESKREWEQLGESINPTALGEELALRKPHLKDRQAALAAAESRLDKALLDLSRTVIRSPLDAIVLSETVEVGDYVTPQTEIAKIVATDAFRVQVSVPVSALRWIEFPKEQTAGSSVQVSQDIGGKLVSRTGKIVRLLSDLDPSGRMARILVEVQDPLGLKSNGERKIPLLIGTYARVEFAGTLLENVFILPREALRENDQVWVKTKDHLLDIRNVEVIQKTDELVIVKNGFEEGEEIVVSHLPLVIPGMPLTTLEKEGLLEGEPSP